MSGTRAGFVRVSGTRVAETHAAMCLQQRGHPKVWIPFSVIDSIHTTREGVCTVHVPLWLAKDKDMEYSR